MKTSSSKVIKTQDGRKIIVNKPRRLDVFNSPPKVIKPDKGGKYKRDNSWKNEI